MADYRELTRVRASRPEEVAAAAARRIKPDRTRGGPLFLIAADHPARAALRIRNEPLAMARRADLLDRLQLALSRPGVDGVVASPDILEDLLLLGALDGKLAVGSMNRGGVQGAIFEIDDRFTGYDAESLAAMNLDGGKMLCRIDPGDAATAATLEACARAVSDLARHRLMALVEPLWASRTNGELSLDLSAEAVIRAISVGQALGATSAHTWLKVPAVDEMERVMEATTLPTLLLGGDPPDSPDEVYSRWERALRLPAVQGLVVGRALLYPPDDDVTAAVDAAAGLVHGGSEPRNPSSAMAGQ